MSQSFETDLYGQTVLKVSRQSDAQLKPLGDVALARLDARVGEHIADIGCGAAQTCLQIAEAVGPSGSVLGVDLSSVLADFAAQRTRAAPQVRIVRADAATFAFRPGCHDAVFSRFGVMAFADPTAAFSNLRRALKPDGRLVFACWRSLQENELDSLPFDAALDHLPPDDIQKVEASAPFSLSSADDIRTILRASGFRAVEACAHDLSVSAGDLESTLELCLSVGALGSLVRRKPDLRRVVAEAVRSALAARDHGQGVFMNAAIWIVEARAA